MKRMYGLIFTFLIACLLAINPKADGWLVVEDENGVWGDDLLFTDFIYPGTEGTYSFTVTNTADVAVTYYLEADGTGDLTDSPFIFYLEVNDLYFELTPNEMAECSFELASGDTDEVTVTWEWPFYVDDEHDEWDTYVGILANQGIDFYVNLSIVAEYDEESSITDDDSDEEEDDTDSDDDDDDTDDDDDDDTDDDDSDNSDDSDDGGVTVSSDNNSDTVDITDTDTVDTDDTGTDFDDTNTETAEDEEESDHRTGDDFMIYLILLMLVSITGVIAYEKKYI